MNTKQRQVNFSFSCCFEIKFQAFDRFKLFNNPLTSKNYLLFQPASGGENGKGFFHSIKFASRHAREISD